MRLQLACSLSAYRPHDSHFHWSARPSIVDKLIPFLLKNSPPFLLILALVHEHPALLMVGGRGACIAGTPFADATGMKMPLIRARGRTIMLS